MDNKNIELLFCGDLAPIGRNEKLILDGVDLFEDVKSDIKKADLAFVNLEAPLTSSNHKINKNGPCLKANPNTIDAIKNAGFNLIGLANNHIMDYDEQGLLDTQNSCAKIGLETVGAGKNLKESQAIYYKKIKKTIIAIIAIAEHEFSIANEDNAGCAPLDMIDNYNQIKEAKANADVVILTLHGGNEYFQYPRPGLRKICKHFVDLGVDAVICHHIHTVGAYEEYKGKFISYGLGNFLFDSEVSNKNWDKGYMVKLDIDENNKINYEIIPYFQNIQISGIKKLKDNEKELFHKDLNSINTTLQNDKLWLKAWDQWCKEKKQSYIVSNYLPFKFRGIGLITKSINLSGVLSLQNTIPSKLNFLECESHREVLVKILNSKMEKN
jgi:poly-gamma-glutamate capsule biosynthesis protein CapA/YwtB (metallophosphatase superfamily)